MSPTAARHGATENSAVKDQRIKVRKTYKLYIGGTFPRSESGRTYEISDSRGTFLANAAMGSRKDARDAVVAARGAFEKWSATTAYNRGQVLYRVAELMEGRRAQFATEVVAAEGLTPARADNVVSQAIDRWVWYAGWSDKIAQHLGDLVRPSGIPHPPVDGLRYDVVRACWGEPLGRHDLGGELGTPALHQLSHAIEHLTAVVCRGRGPFLERTSGGHDGVPGVLAGAHGGVRQERAAAVADLVGAARLAARERPTDVELVGLAHLDALIFDSTVFGCPVSGRGGAHRVASVVT